MEKEMFECLKFNELQNINFYVKIIYCLYSFSLSP